MTFNELEEFCADNRLDLRVLNESPVRNKVQHSRILDREGNQIIDVYFKNGRGNTVKYNSIHNLITNTWGKIKEPRELYKAIDNNI